jgi:hypothetical protein
VNAIKLPHACSGVIWFNGEQTNVSRTISVVVIRELTTKTQTVREKFVYSPLNHTTRFLLRKVLMNSVAVKAVDYMSYSELSHIFSGYRH